MEQKNLILAIALSVAFMAMWQIWVMPRVAPPAPVAAPQTPAPAVSGAAVDTPRSPASEIAAQSVVPVHFDVVGNELELDPRGGAVRQWRLQSKSQIANLVLFADQQPLPLATFPNTLFTIKTEGRRALMSATLPSGVRVEKTLDVADQGHLHRLRLRFRNPTAQPIEVSGWEWGWGPGLGTVPSEAKENANLIRPLSMQRLHAKRIEEHAQLEFGRWAGIDNRYYLVAFIPPSGHRAQVSATGKKETTRLAIHESVTVPARGSTELAYELYVGPKGYTQLKKYERGLEESVDFGWFGGLGKIILSAMYRLHRLTGNYGLAIIVLTFCIQLLVLPLTLKSFKAATAMKKLQPKIAKLQELYKNDPKRLNIEMLNLWKTSGVNPAGGCLPMMLQMPIFFALFTTLRNAYELKGVPFFGWLRDLSVPDPLYILPLLMGGGMYLQQRLSGAVTDPTQRQMMVMMPIMMMVMFIIFPFPSGVALYMLTNSLCMILFQWIYTRSHTSPPGTPDRPEVVKV